MPNTPELTVFRCALYSPVIAGTSLDSVGWSRVLGVSGRVSDSESDCLTDWEIDSPEFILRVGLRESLDDISLTSSLVDGWEEWSNTTSP